MTRLPQPGGDDGTWGDVLNDFLDQAHNTDGSLKPIDSSKISGLAPVATSGSYNDLTNKPSVSDATTTSKGVVQLAGDLGGSAAAPTVPGMGFISVANSSGDVTAITNAISAGTTSGFVNGKWRTKQGQVARISQPTTIALGYTNTQAGNWGTDTSTTQKVKLSLDILPDAGLGTALTIKGGYGVEIDINVLGGGNNGTVSDATMTGRTTAGNGAMAQYSSTLTSASANFTSADVGAPVAVPGAGVSGATLYANISSVTNSTTAVLNTTAQTAVSTAAVYIGSFTVSSPSAIAAGLQPGAVVFVTGAGPSPEGITQPLAVSVRTVNSGAGTFTVSEGCWANVSGATMNWFDVAVRLEDMVGCKLSIYGKAFKGYLLAADATNDTSRRIRSSDFPSIHGNSCGGTIFWKSIEAFGSMGHILSNNNYGDYFGMGADLHWDHWEGGVPQPTSQLARAYLWFDRYGQVNNLSVSVGDRASEASMLMTGDSASSSIMGRFSQVRATNYQAIGASATITSGSNLVTTVVSSSLTFKVGQTIIGPGIPDGTTITAVTGTGNGWTSGSPGTITMSANATANGSAQNVYGVTSDGLKIIGVSSVTITQLDTARCVAGLRVVGGGSVGIRVLHHKSLTSDATPCVIQAGTSAAPRVDVFADYRYMLYYALDLGSGLSSATDVRFRGYVEGVHNGVGGATGKYAARSASSSAVLDIAGLHQKNISGLLGLISAGTAALKGQSQARLDNELPAKGGLYYTDGAGGFTPMTAGSPGQVPTFQSDGSLAPAAPGTSSGSFRTVLVKNTSQVVITNTTTETAVVTYTIPANSVASGTLFHISAGGSFDYGTLGGTLTFRVRIGGVAGTSLFPLANSLPASAATGKGWRVEADVVFRAAASASTPVAASAWNMAGLANPLQLASAPAVNVNMTTARDLVLDVIWSVADTADILRCEYATIEQL